MPRGLVTSLAIAVGLGGLLAYDVGAVPPGAAAIAAAGCAYGEVSGVISDYLAVDDDAPAGEPTPLAAVRKQERLPNADNLPGQLGDPVAVSEVEVRVPLRDEPAW